MNQLTRSFKRLSFSILIFSLVLTGCSKGNNLETSNDLSSLNKEILRIQLYDDHMPEDFKLIDWSKRAIGFDALVFDENKNGPFLPLIWQDETYNSFGMPAYVGDGRMHQNGSQEAVTLIAAVVSASLNGIDKSKGVDYVSQLSAFYSEDEKIILNNPSGSSATTSMWYLLYPTILFAHVSDLYPEHETLRVQLLNAIESWYQAYEVMYSDGNPNFDYTGFNFKTMKPYTNDIWTEPDSAVGIGLLMYYGFQLTNDEKYLTASINSLDYIEGYFGSPLYEALMYFGPYLAARLNAFHGTDYDLSSFLDDNFNATSIPRGGWGSVIGKWGDYDMSGLFGSDTDGGGYVFSMNTFAAASAIAPMAQYDPRYARDLGVWLLNLTSNARYYFATETEINNQSLSELEFKNDIEEEIKKYIPYEGIRKSSKGRTPWFGGDPTVYGWAQTDFSLYSGAHIGMLGSMISETNVEKILEFNLNKTQFFNEDILPSYLIFNPYGSEKKIDYQIKSKEPVDIYNSFTNEIMYENVKDNQILKIPADTAYVITEIPTGSKIEEDTTSFFVDDKFVGKKLIAIQTVSPTKNETVSGEFTLDIKLNANYDAKIKKVKITIDDKTTDFTSTESIVINSKDYPNGNKWIDIEVITEDGRIDKVTHRLKFE